jgi:ankyrin repeat protein
VSVANIVLQAYPAAATMPNNKGKIPLHYAAREGRVEMVQYFISVAPETATIATEKGKLPLHFSVGEGHAHISQLLLHAYPASAALASSKGKLPLHFCARWGYLDIADHLLRVYPDAVRALDWEGSLPLHDAAREGQYRMARYLIERFPLALQTANMRQEIPLFPAVRSGNIDLIVLVIRAWPSGGKFVLRNVAAEDNIQTWNDEIIELLLRGAVDNLSGCQSLQNREPPTVRLVDTEPVVAIAAFPEEPKPKKAKKKDPHKVATAATYPPKLVTLGSFPAGHANTAAWPLGLSTAVMVPIPSGTEEASPLRSKSPILDHRNPHISVDDEDDSLHMTVLRSKKHQRKRSRKDDSLDYSCSTYKLFIPVHAAFECQASSHAIRHVLVRHAATDVCQRDHTGRMALHWAVMHAHARELADLILDEAFSILTPETARVVDHTQHLPLHLAILAKAHVRVISALLRAHPEAGIEPCRTPDQFYDRTPVYMAIHSHSDLSTLFELLRVDPTSILWFRNPLCQQSHKE